MRKHLDISLMNNILVATWWQVCNNLLTKELLTECEVSTGKYLRLRFFYRPSDEGARSVRKNRKQLLSRTDRANEVNKTFIIWLLVHFRLKFATSFLSSEFAVTLSC